ncbi:fasciclin domain-containing protein [Spongiimicrobium salis]|uniref:fasciclin domain-containing protein n=1 Tax=Spongiimicrobium salis TaxID=1667022 RepID=UPI00374D9005
MKNLQVKYMILGFWLIAICSTTSAQIQNQDSDANEKTIIKSTEGSEDHTTLLAALKAADLEEVLDSEGPFTVFAPSDKAFKKLPQGKITALLKPGNKEALKDLVSYHIVAGNLSAAKILKAMCRGRGTATFTTVQGNKITASMKGLDIVLTDDFGNTAIITMADANQCNGVIHVIDRVIQPKKIS